MHSRETGGQQGAVHLCNLHCVRRAADGDLPIARAGHKVFAVRDADLHAHHALQLADDLCAQPARAKEMHAALLPGTSAARSLPGRACADTHFAALADDGADSPLRHGHSDLHALLPLGPRAAGRHRRQARRERR